MPAFRLHVHVRRPAFALAALACGALVLLAPCAARARSAATLDGGTIVFFADTLALVARDGTTLTLADGTRARADAAYVDLKTDRVVLAGHAHVERGAASADADAVAIEMDGDRVDLLDAASGVTRTTRALGTPAAADFDAQRFAFPDVDDRSAFIRSKHAKIAPHADVRFTPGGVPDVGRRRAGAVVSLHVRDRRRAFPRTACRARRSTSRTGCSVRRRR